MMKLFKTHKNIDIKKSLGNIKIISFHYARPIERSDKWEHYTTVDCWYDRAWTNAINKAKTKKAFKPIYLS